MGGGEIVNTLKVEKRWRLGTQSDTMSANIRGVHIHIVQEGFEVHPFCLA